MAGSLDRLMSRRALVGLGIGAAAGAIALGAERHEAAAVALSGVTASVAVDGLRVHASPNSSTIVGHLDSGQHVQCVKTSATWMSVRRTGIAGWVASQYLNLIPSIALQTIQRGPTTVARVCLTFDAGADRGYAPAILDTLKAKGVTASFGMTGLWATANPDLVRRVVDEGHSLINHTFDHRSWTGYSAPNPALTPAERLAELFAAEQRITAACGHGGRPWFRPPYGDYDDSVLNDVAAAGFAYNLMWTVDSLGWNGLAADDIVWRCLTNRGKGYIYLFHVGSQSEDSLALPRVIDGLRSHGYRFGTIQRLLGLAPSAASDDSIPPTTTPTPVPHSPTKVASKTPKSSPTSSSTPTGVPAATASPTPTEPAAATPVAG